MEEPLAIWSLPGLDLLRNKKNPNVMRNTAPQQLSDNVVWREFACVYINMLTNSISPYARERSEVK